MPENRKGEYSVEEIDLSTAGETIVYGPWDTVVLMDARDGANAFVSTAWVKVRSEQRQDADHVHLRVGGKVMAIGTARWVVSWVAQAGVTAYLWFSTPAQLIDAEAPGP